MSFKLVERMAQNRRLLILRLLAETPGYRANESLVHVALDDLGCAVSRDQVLADLAWLSHQGLIEAEQVASVAIATATVRGLDVAAGRAVVPGVTRPRPRS